MTRSIGAMASAGRSEAGPAAEDVLSTPQAGPKALRGGALRTAGYAAGILLSLVSVPLLIGHLGVSDYGRYFTVISLTTIVGGLTEGGLNAIALREYTITGPAERNAIMRDALGIRLIATAAGVAVTMLFVLAAGYGSRLALGALAASTAVGLGLLGSLFSIPLQAELRYGWVSALELLRQVLYVGLLVALLLGGAGLVPALVALIPAYLVVLLLTVALVRGRVPLRPSLSRSRCWHLVRESLPWAVVAAVNLVYFRLVIILMSLSAPAIQTGYFSLSFRIVEVLIGIPALAVGAVYPILTRSAGSDEARFAYAAGRMFELALIAGVWLVVCVEIGAPFAMHVLAGAKGAPAVPVLRIQAPAVLATFIAVACGYPLLVLRQFRAALIANGVALSLSAVLTLALVGPLGARGAALAAVSAEFVLCAVVVAFLRRAGAGVRVPLGAVGPVALAGGAALAAGLLLPVHEVAGVLVATGVFALAIRLLGRFPPEVRELLAARAGAGVR